MRHPVSFVLPLLLLFPVFAIQAQVLPDPGARVRITNSHNPRLKAVGMLERVTPDTIVVAGQLIVRSTIGRVEVSEGRRSQWRRGIAFGFLAGAGAGALAAVIYLPESNFSHGDRQGLFAAMAGMGSGAGMLIGGAIGALTQGDRWRKLPLSSFRLAPIVGRDGALGMSIGWAL